MMPYDAARLHELEAHLRANPDDTAVWAVYGDWLLERGDRRGELVRSRRDPTAEERTRWRGIIPDRAIAEWRYGFVTGVALPLDSRSSYLLDKILTAPDGRLVSSVVIRPWRYRDGEVFDPSHAIDAGDPALIDDPVLALIRLDLRALRRLAIQYTELSDVHVDALIVTKLAITELDLRHTRLTDERLARLLAAPWFEGVRRLHLQNTALTGATTDRLAACAFDYLDIRETAIDAGRMHSRTLVAYDDARTLAGVRTHAPSPPKLVDGLELSHERTERHTTVRFVDKRGLSRSFTKLCARVAELPDHVVVYVDPDEWTFRTFENIVPIDRWIGNTEVELVDHAELGSEIHRFRLAGTLPDFDRLPLYVEPLTASRGGRRYIFHSATLASALTRAVADLRLPGFSHVNPVFRCNRFEPGDEPFHRHFDTPYYDAARDQISQYTLLIYLTGGRGAPALQIENLAIDSIEAMQCFVFHQAYEHAGAAYTDGRKVFLRTELVFEQHDVAHDPRIAALFSKACYLTGESVRAPELLRDADRAYNAVAAAHWSSVLPPFATPFVHKRFAGIEWLANGFDFWFPKSLPLADCAAITLLDYFNCKLGANAFRTLVHSEVAREIDPEAFVASLPAPVPLIAIDKHALFPAPERDDTCCPGHCSHRYDPTTSDEVIELYSRAQAFARARIDPAPIVMLGERVLLDPSKFVIDGNQIHVLSADRPSPVNFAACWNCRSSPQNYVDVDVTASVLHPLVPPILWEATSASHHLMFDFFRNGWALGHRQVDVPVPKIRLADPETVDEDEAPWLDAAQSADVHRGLPRERGPFWTSSYARGGALIDELYAKPRT